MLEACQKVLGDEHPLWGW